MTFVTGSISHGQGRGDPNSYSDIISTWPTRGPRSSRSTGRPALKLGGEGIQFGATSCSRRQSLSPKGECHRNDGTYFASRAERPLRFFPPLYSMNYCWRRDTLLSKFTSILYQNCWASDLRNSATNILYFEF